MRDRRGVPEIVERILFENLQVRHLPHLERADVVRQPDRIGAVQCGVQELLDR